MRAAPESDCEGAPDAVLGNGRCDLAPGTYGDLSVLNDAKLTLLGGTYTFCGFQFGRRTETVASAATIVNVHGDVANRRRLGVRAAGGDQLRTDPRERRRVGRVRVRS